MIQIEEAEAQAKRRREEEIDDSQIVSFIFPFQSCLFFL